MVKKIFNNKKIFNKESLLFAAVEGCPTNATEHIALLKNRIESLVVKFVSQEAIGDSMKESLIHASDIISDNLHLEYADPTNVISLAYAIINSKAFSLAQNAIVSNWKTLNPEEAKQQQSAEMDMIEAAEYEEFKFQYEEMTLIEFTEELGNLLNIDSKVKRGGNEMLTGMLW